MIVKTSLGMPVFISEWPCVSTGCTPDFSIQLKYTLGDGRDSSAGSVGPCHLLGVLV